ncbi:MAG TPA: MBL fold metallo-hydrolase [Myxococcota bacterium]|nr:MBL fold metallo-hydrolase [Myxococcota bacterium]
MRKNIRRAISILVVVIAAALIWGYRHATDLEVARVTEDVNVIYGFGGNVGVLKTDRGAVVVDTMTFRAQGARILELAEKYGGGPVQAVVNTHYHRDHTHGNPAFPKGTPIVATEKTLAYLKQLDAGYWTGDAAGTLPNQTFRNEHELKVADKTIRLIHPGRGHTDGDLVVLFVEDRVLHTGDLYFNGRYPNIDLEAGGSIREWVATIDRVLELDFDRVIPGHGPVTDREGLRAFQTFMRELAEVGAQAVHNGWSLDDTEREAKLSADAGYEVMSIPFVMKLDRAFVVRRAWEEATGNVERIAVPGQEPERAPIPTEMGLPKEMEVPR